MNLTHTGTGHFASFHGTTRPLIELGPRGKNERVARHETNRLVYKLKVLGQPVTSGVRSSAEKSRKPVIADNFASDGARAKFRHPACFSRRIEPGLRSRSRSRSESVVFLGVGVGVDKIYRLRPTPGKLLFLIHRNRHADYLRHFFPRIFL